MALEKTPRADIKAKTRRYYEISLAVALILVISAFAFFPVKEMERVLIAHAQDIVTVTDIPVTEQNTLPPPPPRPPIPIEAPGADDIMPDFDSEPDFDTAPPPPPPLPDRRDADADADEQIFEAVETYPTIIGGTEALARALTYPPLAKRAGIEGTVVVRVLLGKNGRVEKTTVLKSLGGGCDEAAVEAIRKLRFTPGLQRDKPVRVYISIPVHFRLQ